MPFVSTQAKRNGVSIISLRFGDSTVVFGVSAKKSSALYYSLGARIAFKCFGAILASKL